ncbi:Hsp20/alpha crystallin family protein [Haloarchaeobius amylolyticus]|uniref:Hsp20/alpha crystallin family protein n=1 Tax=Haloarchaeobius amylolyticus TaxID=1198296 RepID=UPI00226D5174|nr:Hsp20/alpha crystallin family protein [Haloarchaeobius amylolyticus]
MSFKRFDDMNSMFDQMDRMFDQMRRNWAGMTPELETRRGDLTTRANVGSRGFEQSGMMLTEEDTMYVFVMDIPGFEKSDIACTYDDGMLRIVAEREEDESAENVWMRRSRRMSEQVRIPREILADEITASYRNGVLEVHLPFATMDEESGRSIDIQ